jgi:hypothetical protein
VCTPCLQAESHVNCIYNAVDWTCKQLVDTRKELEMFDLNGQIKE